MGVGMTGARSELDLVLSLGSLGMLLVDPNSTTGLRYEGFCARQRGKARNENPYSTPRFKGCLAEGHWWEGWDAAERAASGIEAATADETALAGSAEGESPVAKPDAQEARP
jgi:hypothetical protein